MGLAHAVEAGKEALREPAAFHSLDLIPVSVAHLVLAQPDLVGVVGVLFCADVLQVLGAVVGLVAVHVVYLQIAFTYPSSSYAAV